MEALSAILAHDEVPGSVPATSPAGAGAADLPFGRLVSEGLQTIDLQLKTSQADLQQLALGEAPNLHEMMIRLEESRIAFQFMLQVRNRVLEAYQDVMKMQV
jgi:flagellar hook-basal body complex protein FliE